MSYEGPNLGLETGFAENQDGWGGPYNEAMRRLDALTERLALDVVDELPGSPTDGDRYLLSAVATENANKFAVRVQGAWSFYAPPLIQTIFVKSLGFWVCWQSDEWVDQGVPSHGHSIGGITGLTAALSGKQDSLGYTAENTSNKGNAGGYASLDGSGKIPTAQLPANGGRPAAQTLDADHELAYSFSESSGNFVNTGDQGTGQNISTIGTALLRRSHQGPFGDCIRVSSTGSPLTGSTYNPPGGAFTIEAWLLPLSFPSGAQYLVNKSRLTSGQSGAASDTAITIYLDTTRNLVFALWSGGATRSIASTDGPVVPDQWNHLAATYDGTTLRAFVNGVEVATGTHSGTVDFGTPGSWHFAAFPNVTGFGPNGYLAHVLISSVVRNAAYMKAAFRRGMPGISAVP